MWPVLGWIFKMSQIGKTILKELKTQKKRWEETPYAVNVNKTGEHKKTRSYSPA